MLIVVTPSVSMQVIPAVDEYDRHAVGVADGKTILIQPCYNPGGGNRRLALLDFMRT